jgi:hypothetical protein
MWAVMVLHLFSLLSHPQGAVAVAVFQHLLAVQAVLAGVVVQILRLLVRALLDKATMAAWVLLAHFLAAVVVAQEQ